MIHYNKKLKNKKSYVFSKCRESFSQNSTFIYDKKKSPEVSIEGTYFHIIKAIFDKPQLTYPTMKNLEAFPLSQEQDKNIYSHNFIQHSFGSSSHSKENK